MNHRATQTEALRAIFADQNINARRPSEGRRVRVIEGKLLGVEGVVTWHGIDKFNRGWRYLDSMQAHLRDAIGQYGYRVRVQPDDGDAFFIAADRVCVL